MPLTLGEPVALTHGPRTKLRVSLWESLQEHLHWKYYSYVRLHTWFTMHAEFNRLLPEEM